ncbi:MAG: glycoside hydrolase family 127 protein [Lachnospiraceae bacterium]|nr:glycoside hydrolase family 127 protein [Lachnospiraceae bacterium]
MNFSKVFKRVFAAGLATVVGVTSIPTDGLQNVYAAENFAESNVLNLAFENNLTDSSVNNFAVSVGNGEAGYVEGITEDSQAFLFNGSTWLDLGTDGDLSPENLTLSFWMKPESAISGEQVITWSKYNYNEEGWYLSSNSDTAPLILSVGAAAEHPPYEFSVSATRSEFFPVGEWTHVVVTYASETKEAKIYRNGTLQEVQKNSPSASATGVITPAESVKKTIGFNGPAYNSSYLNNIAIDEYQLYNTVATQADVDELFAGEGVDIDERKIELDKAALTLPETTKTDIELPTAGVNGSIITWESDNEAVIAADGTVTRPDAETGDVEVKLTATIVSGEERDTKEFIVTVKAKAAEPATFADANVLNLKFEDNLTDSSAKNTEVTVGKGTATYVEGITTDSKAMKFNGSTYLDLGTDGDLSPENLTLSFWIKPDSAMDGEQLITWNKNEWYTDGWYLSSGGDNGTLALSVGPAATEKQPYLIKLVNDDRASFFPAGEWTNVIVTYDVDTKVAKIYRNGIPQATTVKYGLSTTSTGVIGPCENTKKTIGYNGPVYKASYLKNLALDEYRLYNTAASLEEAISIYEESGKIVDRKAVAQQDLDTLVVADSVAGNMRLVAEGTSGSVITWTSSNPEWITNEGIVTRPAEGEESVMVTLTAKASFAGGEAVEKAFNVTVRAVGDTGNNISDISLSDVELADDYLINAEQKEYDYLLSLNSKKFLYQFYKTAGLTPPTEEGYGGWEREADPTFRGHMFGHYMSGLAQAYKGCDDADTKAKLYEQIVDAVEGLKECQDAYALTNPKSAGYIAPFKEGRLDAIDGSSFSGQSHSTDSNVFVPWYNLHKVLAGLIDIYTFVDEDAVAGEALGIAEGFSEYIYNRCTNLTDNTKMLGTEYGGMNEALYEIYDITGNEHFKIAAHYFDETELFTSLANNQDVLSGKHANTTIPKLTGALKRYTVMTNNEEYYNALTADEQADLEMYKTAAVNFWDIVINHHTYITGGNSQSEHFHNADELHYDATKGDYDGSTTCETCNTYNMLKLSRELYKLTKDKKYMDYYENTYLNAIVSSQNPETGTTMYFQPMAPGYNKVFNEALDEFWCCTGTGVENFSKLGDTYYFTEKSDIYVNMYFANTYEYAKQNIRLTMDADMPNNDVVTVTVDAVDGTQVTEGTNLKFRIPDWVAGEPVLVINGETQTIIEENGYVTVSNVNKGDVITWTFPMEVVAYATQDNENFIAFKYGPVVLSTALGTNGIKDSNPNGIIVRVGTKDTTCQTVITVNADSVEEWKANIKENLVRIEDSEDGKVQFVLKNTDSPDLIYTPHYMRYKERYGLYMTFEVVDSESAQKRIKASKEMLRDAETSIDSLYSFDANNSEAAKNMQSNKSSVGSWMGRTFRHAEKDGGWFSYDLAVDQAADYNYLECIWYSGDKERNFDLYINDEKLQTITITDTAGTNVFYAETYEIPEEYWADNDVITAKFRSNGNTVVGGIFGIAVKNTLEYSDNPDITALSFDKGTLSPAFDGSVKNYTLTVPADTESVAMNLSPNVASGMIYVGDILIDDTVERIIPLTGDTTLLTFDAYAQDHETSTAYTVTIKKQEKATGGNETTHTHAYTYKDNGNGTHTATCKDNDSTVTEAHKYVNSVCICGAKEAVKDSSISTGKDTTPQLTTPTPDLILADNAAIPTGKSEEAKGAKFGVLKAQVKKSTKNSNKVQWAKVKEADGYVVLGNMCNSGKKKYAYEVLTIIDKNSTTSYTHKGLKKATYYKYIVQAYKMVDGKVSILETSKTIHSATKSNKSANVKSLKVNKKKVTLAKKGKTFKLKVTQKKTSKKFTNHRDVSYESSNTKVATVDKNGKITAKKKGTCTIYVYAQNGVYQTVKVTVKK